MGEGARRSTSITREDAPFYPYYIENSSRVRTTGRRVQDDHQVVSVGSGFQSAVRRE